MFHDHFPPPPPPPPHFGNDRERARIELDSAYRELGMGELIVQEIDNHFPNSEEAQLGKEILIIANRVYRSAYSAYQREEFFKAAEFSVCVKDLMRGIDKFKHTMMFR